MKRLSMDKYLSIFRNSGGSCSDILTTTRTKYGIQTNRCGVAPIERNQGEAPFLKTLCCIMPGICLVVLLLGAGCVSSQRLPRYSPRVADRNVAVLPMRHVRILGPASTNGADSIEMADSGTDDTKRVLQKGDRVEIFLQGIPVPREIKDVIDSHGKVNLPLIENVEIANLTTFDAEKLVEKSYVDGGYYRKIEVSIVALSVVAKIDAVFAGGEIKRPGTYPLSAHLTLTRAIIAAGGYTDFANRKKIQVTHRDGISEFFNSKLIEMGEEVDPAIRAGDVIKVHRGLF
ncbi:MAG: SLBB domain-containing protein [Kiritimatiellae bacterium]|nr:SLBB domain-containing protein [Kiritimatiellia bacterium]